MATPTRNLRKYEEVRWSLSFQARSSLRGCLCFSLSHRRRSQSCSYLHYALHLAMSDVQNFFLEALAVIFVKVHYLYFRRKLSASSIRWYQFPVAHSMYAEVTLILIFFPYKLPLNKNVNALSLYCTDS